MLKRPLPLICTLALMIVANVVPAAHAGDVPHGISGEMLYRWNGFDNLDQNSDLDDGYAFGQFLAAIEFHGNVNDDASYNLTLENYRVFGDETSEIKEIYQATFTLADFLFEDFDLTLGRMPVGYGRERIVGKNSWDLDPHARMVFEGGHGRYAFAGGWLDFFNFKLAETYGEKYDYGSFNGVGDTDLLGLYLHYDAGDDFWFEPYALLKVTENYRAPTDVDDDKLFTFGALVDYMSEGVHFYAEATVQAGTVYGMGTDGIQHERDISALGWYAGLFYDFDASTEPFLGIEYDFASGQDTATEELDAFHSPAGSSRDFLGIMNIVPWTNVKALHFAGGFTPSPALDVTVDYYVFDREQSLVGEDDRIGTELDIAVDYALRRHVDLRGGLGLFTFDEALSPVSKTISEHHYMEPGDTMVFAWLGAGLEF